MKGPLKFLKMSGAGNDFIVLGPEGARALEGELEGWIRKVCRRGLSVGADGVLLVEPEGDGNARMRFFNPDASAAFCGNGARCAARFAHLRGFTGTSLVLRTCSGEVPADLVGDVVRLRLPRPVDRGPVRFERDGEVLDGRLVDAMVPHLVVGVEDVGAVSLDSWGPWIRRHPSLGTSGANVDFIAWRSDGSLAIRTWERGVEGETLSCGSGALAAAAVAREERGSRSLRILPASGVPLEVRFPESADEARVIMEGDARIVFEGILGEEAVSGFAAC